MAGIYTRDNVNYSQMLQNAIANRARSAEREAAYIQNQGKLWGDTVTNIGNMAGRAVGGYNNWKGDTTVEDEEDAELELLKKQLEEYKAQQAEAAAYHGQVQTATNLMQGYHPQDSFVQDMNESYNQNYFNPYNYELMQGTYRRGR